MDIKTKFRIWRYSGRENLAGIGATVLSIALTAALLLCMVSIPGGKAHVQTVTSADSANKFQMELNNRISDALEGVASIKKVYWISDSSYSAPKPNHACYGETHKPAKMQKIIDQAADLLEGQKLYFSPDVELFEDSTIRWYLDDTIFAITWKELKNDVVLTYAEVKIVHPSQFRRFLSGGEFGSGVLSLTTEMAESVNAVVACSGDYYSYRFQGIVVSDGLVRRNNPGVPDVCYVTKDGDLMLVRGESFDSSSKAQKFVNKNNINFSLAFGPILVQDGEKLTNWDYPLGEILEFFTRAAICQMDKLHYLYIAANSEGNHSHLPEINEFAQFAYETGCRQAYTLDGGQTTTVVMDNDLVNHVNYGSQRLISDIIYFATAIPEGG